MRRHASIRRRAGMHSGLGASPAFRAGRDAVPPFFPRQKPIQRLAEAAGSDEERLGVQPKLTISRPGDRWEQEADRVAEDVVSDRPPALAGPLPVTPLVQLQDIGEEEEKELQRKAARPVDAGMAAANAQAAAAALSSGGRPLSAGERAYFEPRFGRDLSAVRIHEGATADAAARAINARGYTLGNDIALATGQYVTGTEKGQRLLAHELTHTLQQQSVAPSAAPIQRDNDDDEEEPAPAAPTRIDLSFDPTIAIPARAGGTARLQARTDGERVTWSIKAGTATVAPTTSISDAGVITLEVAQTGGSLTVEAENASGVATSEFFVASIPTGIDSTSVSSDLNTSATEYGAAFQHTFTSADGSSDVLENLKIGERFPTAPSPAAATHRFRGNAWPFGRGRDSFTLSTGTLQNDGSGGWALDASGLFGPPAPGSPLAQGDNVGTEKSLIDVGDHVLSASNLRPRNRLPVTFTLDQRFFYFNPRAASGRRWTHFTTTAHSRTLRLDGNNVEFVTTVNGVEHEQDYEGLPAVFDLTASPVSTPRSAAPPGGGVPAPVPRTVSLTVRTLPGTLPTGSSLNWTIEGASLGCTIAADAADPTRATLTIGSTAGTVTVQAAESSGRNFDRVNVRIT